MRISDWSSDVCSSDLSLIPYRTACTGSMPPRRCDQGSVQAHRCHRFCIVGALNPSRGWPTHLTQQALESLHSSRQQNRRSCNFQYCEHRQRSEEHTSELQSLMRISYAVFCLKKNTNTI